jgi:hypothetical protein
LFSENFKKVEQVRIAMVMLRWKAKIWWGQVKVNHEAGDQPLVNTWAKFKHFFIA